MLNLTMSIHTTIPQDFLKLTFQQVHALPISIPQNCLWLEDYTAAHKDLIYLFIAVQNSVQSVAHRYMQKSYKCVTTMGTAVADSYELLSMLCLHACKINSKNLAKISAYSAWQQLLPFPDLLNAHYSLDMHLLQHIGS